MTLEFCPPTQTALFSRKSRPLLGENSVPGQDSPITRSLLALEKQKYGYRLVDGLR
jgi:hypothetical protein